MIRSNSRLIAPSSSGPRVDALHVLEHLRLARRLVDLQAGRLLLVADLQRARGPRAQQPDELLVDLVDPPAELVEPAHTALFSHRTYSPARSATSADRAMFRNHVDEGAADDRGVGRRAGLGHLFGRRDAEAERDGQRRLRAHARRRVRAMSAASRSRTPVTPSREIT